MGKAGNEKNAATIPNPKGDGKEKRKRTGILSGIITFLAAALIILGILGGAFYLIVHNNFNGLTEKYRVQIQSIPVLRLALPAPQDPDDPKNFSIGELRQKYMDLRQTNTEMEKQLEEVKKTASELQKYKDERDGFLAENVKALETLQEKQQQLDLREKGIKEDRAAIDALIGSNDKDGFKAYFETMDKENAARIYAEIVKEQAADGKILEFAGLYEKMDPAAAAKIFEAMGDTKIDLAADTLHSMNKETAAEVLAAMGTTYASKVAVRLYEKYGTVPKEES